LSLRDIGGAETERDSGETGGLLQHVTPSVESPLIGVGRRGRHSLILSLG
jgi:hypothetical protein